MTNKKYIIQLKNRYNDNFTRYYGGFDGDLAYDFVGRRSAFRFDKKRNANKQLRKLKKECSFDKEYEKLKIIKLKKKTK